MGRGDNPWDHTRLDRTERLTLSFHFHLCFRISEYMLLSQLKQFFKSALKTRSENLPSIK